MTLAGGRVALGAQVLKPCPFCGGEAYLELDAFWHYVVCDGCGVQTLDQRNEDEAINNWNKRSEYESQVR